MPNNYVLLETIALTQSAASVTFDNLPTSGYTDLKVVASARADAVDGGTASWMSTLIRINGSSTGSHSFIYGTGSGAFASSNGSTIWTYTVGSNATANTFGSFEFYLPNYRSTTQFKSYSVDAVTENNATLSGLWMDAGLVSNNAAVTSLGFATNTGNFVAGSTFSLYGIAALNTTPILAPKATGGNIVANDGTFWYHAFTSSGNFVPQVGLTADLLVVAGGGGGSYYFGSGAGAGGLLTFTGQSLLNGTNYNCIVGAGGSGATSGSANTGNDSQFGALTLVKGGGGGQIYDAGNGINGGSGSGAVSSSTNRTGGSPTTGQGFAGGNVVGGLTGFYPNAGGGGAGGVGESITSGSDAGGDGGVGLTSALTNAMGAATNLGQLSSSNYYFAGGGGAGSFGGGGVGAGGLGGGGAGSAGTGTAGTANTGGGGGAAGSINTSNLGGRGGSGVIIIRYPIA
jgi:hypothetical protein